MFITIFVSVWGFALFCMGVALFRNNWVFKTRGRFQDKVSLWCDHLIEHREYSIERQREGYECIWDYNKMFRRFWVWNIEGMIEDERVFDQIYYFKENENANND